MKFIVKYSSARILLLFVFLLLFVCGCNDESAIDELCIAGTSCNDGSSLTENDTYDDNCNCIGTSVVCPGVGDEDNDGICADEDCNDLDSTIVTIDLDGDGLCSDIDCDDNDSTITEIDNDQDGFCTPIDCNDNNASVFPGSSCSDGNPGTENDVLNENCDCVGEVIFGSLTDPRDDQMYLTIQVGNDEWMADNLNYAGDPFWCYDEDTALCNAYGKLYRWQVALDVCPEGWHLPNVNEWQVMVNWMGGDDLGGASMKDTTTWNSPNTGATNSGGFFALPGGCRTFSGDYSNLGDRGFWWTSEESQSDNVWTRVLNYNNTAVNQLSNHRGDGMSVRCVKD